MSKTTNSNWAHVDLTKYPNMKVPAPGPESKKWHERCTKYFKGLSGQVKLFPVAFESGHGCILKDVDGNEYIDFSSGIYVTTLGHCHPKVTEAVQKHAGTLMNAHDFTTPIKAKLMEKMAATRLPWQNVWRRVVGGVPGPSLWAGACPGQSSGSPPEPLPPHVDQGGRHHRYRQIYRLL